MDAPRLLPPGTQPGFIGTLSVPGDLWWVSQAPVPLAGMAYPRKGAFPALTEAGFGHIVCLTDDPAPYDADPLSVTAIKLQDMIVRRTPKEPELEAQRVYAAADDVLEHLANGIGVAVHCHGGRGRTGSVIGCALVRLGHDPETVVDWLHRVQRTRGRRGWPESKWQAAVVLATPTS